MKFLRPQQHKDSHMVTFLVGNASFSLSLSLRYIRMAWHGT